jgi:hypothetical protein
MDKKLFCYAYGHGNQWEAICIDFDLAVAGRSFKEVQERLNSTIASYVQDALKEDEQTRDCLLERSAPFGVRLKLAIKLFWSMLRHRNGSDGNYYAGYNTPCRA